MAKEALCPRCQLEKKANHGQYCPGNLEVSWDLAADKEGVVKKKKTARMALTKNPGKSGDPNAPYFRCFGGADGKPCAMGAHSKRQRIVAHVPSCHYEGPEGFKASPVSGGSCRVRVSTLTVCAFFFSCRGTVGAWREFTWTGATSRRA